MSENYLPINLPSKCLPYDGIDPSNVLIRPYQGADEILLAQITPINLEQKFLCVLKRVIQGIDPSILTIGDRLYVMLWEFINSYTNVVSVRTTCSYCLKEVAFQVDLSTLDVNYLPDNYKQPYSVTLSKEKVDLKLLTVNDMIEVEKYAQKDVENGLLYEYAHSIVDNKSLQDRVSWLSLLSSRDLGLIRAFQEKFLHRPNMNTKAVCPRCKEEEEIVVPFRLEFLFPIGKTLTDAFGERI